jgi:diguanylate cyclase
MDSLILSAAIAIGAGLVGAAAGFGLGRQVWHRARCTEAEAEVTSLRCQLHAERHAASHDPLTGLPNRRALYRLGAAMMTDPARHPLVAIVIDLDDFKQINDRLGHDAGDQVLVTMARRFATYAGDNLVARLGGDEFAGLLSTTAVDAHRLDPARQRLAMELAAPMQVAGYTLTVTASVGLVPVSGHTDVAEALRRADLAMYRAKTSRRQFPSPAPPEPFVHSGW